MVEDPNLVPKHSRSGVCAYVSVNVCACSCMCLYVVKALYAIQKLFLIECIEIKYARKFS